MILIRLRHGPLLKNRLFSRRERKLKRFAEALKCLHYQVDTIPVANFNKVSVEVIRYGQDKRILTFFQFSFKYGPDIRYIAALLLIRKAIRGFSGPRAIPHELAATELQLY